jgi:hypothetical protein
MIIIVITPVISFYQDPVTYSTRTLSPTTEKQLVPSNVQLIRVFISAS